MPVGKQTSNIQYSSGRRWPWLLLVFVGVFLAWAAPTAAGLHQRWMNASFEHGYPIFFMTCFLVFNEYRRMPLRPGPTSWLALAVLAACAAITVVAQAADVNIVSHLVLPTAVMAAIWMLVGWNSVLRFAVPILFIYFAIPFWQIAEFLPVPAPSLNEGLRMLTTTVVSAAIGITAIPAYVYGNFIEVPYGTFEVAEGCSGRAFFIVGVELALFYGLAFLRNWNNRLILLGSVMATALVANWIRVYSLVIIGYLSEMQNPLIQSHSTFGWFIFMLVIAPMIIVANRLENREQKNPEPAKEPAATGGTSGSLVAATAVVVLTLAFMANVAVHLLQSADPGEVRITSPALDGWQRVGTWKGESRPVFPGAYKDAAAWYENRTGRVGVYLAGFPVQKERAEAVYFANRPAGESGAVKFMANVSIRQADGVTQPYVAYRVYGEDLPRLLWHGIRVAGTPATGQFHAKFMQVLGLAKGRTDAQVLILTAVCEPDCDAAEASLRELAGQTKALFAAAGGKNHEGAP